MSEALETLYSLEEIRGLTKRSVSTLRGDMRRGRLDVIRLGNAIRVKESSLRSYIESGGNPKHAA